LLPALEKKRKTLPGPKPVLLIKGDADVSWGVVEQVLALARQAGFDSLVAYQPINPSDNTTPATPAAKASTASGSGGNP